MTSGAGREIVGVDRLEVEAVRVLEGELGGVLDNAHALGRIEQVGQRAKQRRLAGSRLARQDVGLGAHESPSSSASASPPYGSDGYVAMKARWRRSPRLLVERAVAEDRALASITWTPPARAFFSEAASLWRPRTEARDHQVNPIRSNGTRRLPTGKRIA